ncbi:hypothetical protein [Petrachloros mirabilis]
MSAYPPSVISPFRTDGFDPQIGKLFDEALYAFDLSGQAWAPVCNAWEDNNGFFVQMALSG